jgi:hypothetical protein
MTYQEILVEFDTVRLQDMEAPAEAILMKRIMNLEWAIQTILEKLRDAEPITK